MKTLAAISYAVCALFGILCMFMALETYRRAYAALLYKQGLGPEPTLKETFIHLMVGEGSIWHNVPKLRREHAANSN